MFSQFLLGNPAKPKTIRMVHLAQVHGVGLVGEGNAENTSPELFSEISLSQFRIARTILANPEALVLDEDLTCNVTHDKFHYKEKFHGEFSVVDIRRIRKNFPQGFPKTYEEITMDQKNDLVGYGAPHVLFSLNLLKEIYKTADPGDPEKIAYKLKDRYQNLSLSALLYYRIFKVDQELRKIIYDDREEKALRFAEKAALKSAKINPLVFIVYGRYHQFGDTIKRIQNPYIHYEGRVETAKVDEYTRCENEKIFVEGASIGESKDTISIKKFQEILGYYRTKYQSKSIFSSGYSSPAMRELVKYLAVVEKGHQNICYQEVLVLLAGAENARAQLFKDGPKDNQLYPHATDKIILDLRSAFLTAGVQAENEAKEDSSDWFSKLSSALGY